MTTAALFLLLGFFQNAAPAAMEGTVIDSITGRPLAGAAVQLSTGGRLLAADTAPDGTFVFRNIPPGPFTIVATRAGYIPNSRPDPLPGVSYLSFNTTVSGQTLSGIQIALTPGAVIYGRLVDDRGEAVVGTTVQAHKTEYWEGNRRWTTPFPATAISNDLGEYRLFLLSPGEYLVSAAVPQLSSPGQLSREVIVSYFPGTLDVGEAQRIDLRAGEVVGGIDFSSFPTRTRRIAGTVEGTGGQGAAVVLSPRNGTQSLEQSIDPATGVFEFNVVSGPYVLVAGNRELKAAMPLDVRNADVLNARVTMAPGHVIPFRVRIEGHGEGDDPELENVRFQIQPVPAIPAIGADMYGPFAHGGFTPHLLPGDYRIDVTSNLKFYVKSMTWEGVNILNRNLHVTGPSDAPVEVLVSTAFGSVEGRVERKGVTVVLVPDASRRGLRSFYQWATPDPTGRFRFEKVPPGEYKLFAWQEQNGGPWLDPEYLLKYEDRGVPLRVEEGKQSGPKTIGARPVDPLSLTI